MRVTSIAERWGWLKLSFAWLVSCSSPCPVAPPVAPTPLGAAVTTVLPPAAEPDPPARCPIWYAPLSQQRASLPASFDAAIPYQSEELRNLQRKDRAGLPSWSYWRGGVCEGDPDVLARLRTSIARAIADGRTPDELIRQYEDLLESCSDDEAVCAFAREQQLEVPASAASDLYFEVLTRCSDDATVAYFGSADVPADRYIEWHSRVGHQPVDSPRLRRFASEIIRDGPLWQVTRAAAQLADPENEEDVQLLFALRRKLPEPKRRVAVGIALGYVPAAAADFARSCVAAKSIDALFQATESYCERRPPPDFAAPPGLDALREYNHRRRARRELSDADRERLARGLETCLEAGPPPSGGNLPSVDFRDECLAVLGAMDPARARELATKYSSDAKHELREVAAAIASYQDNEAFTRALRELGLRARAHNADSTEPRRRALDLLQGYQLRFGGIGESHLTVLYALRRRLGLQRLFFAEETKSGSAEGTPRLAAYDGRLRYETNSLATMDTVNVVSLVGFANSLARSLGAKDRVAIAAAPNQQHFQPSDITFVFGSEQSLCQLDQNRLLRLVRVSDR